MPPGGGTAAAGRGAGGAAEGAAVALEGAVFTGAEDGGATAVLPSCGAAVAAVAALLLLAVALDAPAAPRPFFGRVLAESPDKAAVEATGTGDAAGAEALAPLAVDATVAAAPAAQATPPPPPCAGWGFGASAPLFPGRAGGRPLRAAGVGFFAAWPARPFLRPGFAKSQLSSEREASEPESEEDEDEASCSADTIFRED